MKTDHITERGFTLIEVLVVLALLAAIVAIVGPTVFSQLDKGDATQVAGDLDGVGSAIKSFRVDISPVYPGDALDLNEQIDGSDETLTGDPYSQGQQNRWAGPYLESQFDHTEPPASTTPAFGTGFGGDILADFWVFNSASTPNENTSAGASNTTGDWVAVRVNNLSKTDFDEIDKVIDGEVDVDAGRFQWDATAEIAYFLAAQR